jgi:hypothetical protein
VYLVSYDKFLYKTEDGGVSWAKVSLPDEVRDELVFHQSSTYKDHIMLVTLNNQVSTYFLHLV